MKGALLYETKEALNTIKEETVVISRERIRAEAKANVRWNEEARQESKKLFIIN